MIIIFNIVHQISVLQKYYGVTRWKKELGSKKLPYSDRSKFKFMIVEVIKATRVLEPTDEWLYITELYV